MAATLGAPELRAVGRSIAVFATPAGRTVRPSAEPRIATPPAESRLVRATITGDVMLTWPKKDPDDILDYAIDWSARLDGDKIASVELFVKDDLVISSQSQTDQKAVI
jgi:hypothetical protein